MSVAPSAAREADRRVTCPDCGGVRWLSARRAREVQLGRSTGRCDDCRRGRVRTAQELHALCRWWLDRYSDEELAAFALALGVGGACSENVARARRRLRGAV